MEEENIEDLKKKETNNNKRSKSFLKTIQQIDMLKENSLSIENSKTIEERKPGYRKANGGGLECFNQEELKNQEGF